MKNICKIISIFSLLLLESFGMTEGTYNIIYRNVISSKQIFDFTNFKFTNSEFNIIALTKGTEDEKFEVMDNIFKRHSQNIFNCASSEEMKVEDILFDMMHTPIDDYYDPSEYNLTDSEGNNITKSILGILPQNFIEQKLNEIEILLTDFPKTLKQMRKYKQILVTDYRAGMEMSTDELISLLLQDSEYETIQDYNSDVRDELGNNYTDLIALELIGILHNMKVK